MASVGPVSISPVRSSSAVSLRTGITVTLLAVYVLSFFFVVLLYAGVGLGRVDLSERLLMAVLLGMVVNPVLLLIVIRFWFPAPQNPHGGLEGSIASKC